MERINRRSRTDPIAVGEPIVVYTERAHPQPGDELYADGRSRAELGRSSPRSDAPSGPAAVADAPDVE
jgi:hypothetical protein